jgi:hypothetical protein
MRRTFDLTIRKSFSGDRLGFGVGKNSLACVPTEGLSGSRRSRPSIFFFMFGSFCLRERFALAGTGGTWR